jgi:hypothetical protein
MKKDYLHPGVMMTASILNIIGGLIAISNGSAKQNEFFYFNFMGSIAYAGANLAKCFQVYQENNKKTFVEKVEAERELKQVTIQR